MRGQHSQGVLCRENVPKLIFSVAPPRVFQMWKVILCTNDKKGQVYSNISDWPGHNVI